MLVLLIVSWCIYDNYYIYTHTLEANILKYKPGSSYSLTAEDNPISNEMVAWVTIDNTDIDYPVMQSSDNIKYLNTDPFGSYSLSGSIFLDSRNSPDFSDNYSVLYGHHMERGKMFGALDSFLDNSYLKKHTSGSLIIGKDASAIHDLTVFACIKADAKNKKVFEFEENDILSYIKNNYSVIDVEEDKPILALSTCSGGDVAERTVVFCYIDK